MYIPWILNVKVFKLLQIELSFGYFLTELIPPHLMDIMSDANIGQINSENICDSNYLRLLIEERDRKEKIPFENLIFTSKNKK